MLRKCVVCCVSVFLCVFSVYVVCVCLLGVFSVWVFCVRFVCVVYVLFTLCVCLRAVFRVVFRVVPWRSVKLSVMVSFHKRREYESARNKLTIS